MIQRPLLGMVLATLLITTPAVPGQSTTPAAWQTAAGGTMSFDVASIRPSEPGKFTPPYFPLSPDDSYVKTGGLFVAGFRLVTYIEFAYKLWLSPEQRKAIRSQLPKWAAEQNWDIRARTSGDPSKDQMRLMMQSLLVDRFKLAIHFETREVPVLALTVIKPGKLGPKLYPHADGPACDHAAPLPEGTFPAACDEYEATQTANHRIRMGSRNTTMPLLAASLPSLGQLGRPVVDQTGLIGRFDFTLEWEPEANRTAAGEAPAPSDSSGPNVFEAVRDQLGLKLESSKAPIEVVIVDHVERPSDN